MILDDLARAQTYFDLEPGIVIALQYLRQTDLGAIAPGRHAIDEDRVFALVSDYDTTSVEHSAWEAHRRHVDVQYVVSGEERFGIARLETLDAGPYDDERDILFAKGEGEFVTLRPGRFAILFPHDAHMPGVSPGHAQRVRKVVVKVRVKEGALLG